MKCCNLVSAGSVIAKTHLLVSDLGTDGIFHHVQENHVEYLAKDGQQCYPLVVRTGTKVTFPAFRSDVTCSSSQMFLNRR